MYQRPETISATVGTDCRERRIDGENDCRGRQYHAGYDHQFLALSKDGFLPRVEREAVVSVADILDAVKTGNVGIRHHGRVGNWRQNWHSFPLPALCGSMSLQSLKIRSVQAGTTAKQSRRTLASPHTFTGSRLVNKTLQAVNKPRLKEGEA